MSVAADMPKQDVALRAAGNAASLFSSSIAIKLVAVEIHD